MLRAGFYQPVMLEIQEAVIMSDPDYLPVMENLLAAVEELREQIAQMQGMFADQDGSIQSAIDNAQAAEKDARTILGQHSIPKSD